MDNGRKPDPAIWWCPTWNIVTEYKRQYLITKNSETFLQTKLEPVATCYSDHYKIKIFHYAWKWKDIKNTNYKLHELKFKCQIFSCGKSGLWYLKYKFINRSEKEKKHYKMIWMIIRLYKTLSWKDSKIIRKRHLLPVQLWKYCIIDKK